MIKDTFPISILLLFSFQSDMFFNVRFIRITFLLYNIRMYKIGIQNELNLGGDFI